MIQFFQNLWAWISGHADEIAALFSVPNLVLIITAFVQLRRQKRDITANTGSSRELRESLQQVKEARGDLDALSSRINGLEERMADLQDQNAQCITKLNCVLEVQQQAYSVSLAKTQTLDAINGIISNGKYAETHARKAITDEVAELREQMEKLTAATKASEEKVKRIAGVTEKAGSAKGVRYD